MQAACGRAGVEDGAAVLAGAGAEFQEVVGAADDVQVVFDEPDGVAAVHQGVEQAEDVPDVLRVEAVGGFVDDEDLPLHAQVGSQFEPLEFAAGKGGKCLVQMEIL